MREQPVADVDVVIVAYRSRSYVAACLEALAGDPAVASIHVVDNDQDAAVAEMVARHDRPERPATCTPRPNIGFGRACNLAAARGVAPYVALVNPDVVITSSLALLRDVLAVRPEQVATGHLRTDGTCPSNTKHGFSVRREVLRSVVGASRAYAAGAPGEKRIWHAAHADGALLVMSRESWERLAGFDERYELYYEDVDLTARAGGVAVLAEEVGVHAAGSSAEQATATVLSCLQVSRLRWLRTRGRPGSAAALSLLEWTARSVTRRGEGQAARNTALRHTLRELRRPGSVQVLSVGTGRRG